MSFFLEVLIGGLMAGVLYSLVALGFVLIFKASGVFNFAQGAMVLFAALTLVRLTEWMPFWAAFAMSCLVMIDHETVAQFAQERNVPFSNFASLCRAPEVQALIGSEIERVNRELARVETIKAFRLIEQLLTAEDEELTPTMKLKRTFVNVKYKDLIDGMYERSHG